jgi:hypothetical protein
MELRIQFLSQRERFKSWPPSEIVGAILGPQGNTGLWMKEKLSRWITCAHDQFFQRDYWRLKDEEPEIIANDYHIPPLSRAGKNGEHWYVDRERIIKSLTEHDATTGKLERTAKWVGLIGAIVGILIAIARCGR